ncbi:MAG: phosphoadenylyl-sulfate reductase [Kiritimatiellae bacterium]|nr:phosphoadenylyl-sulfate reductase [Verrucomicrobiota bacterium]MCG2659701.1 phosphoadenylyl-sulfate reductase [Kiritimatiellia bacterium]
MELDRPIKFPATEEAQDLLKWGLDSFHPAVALACSFSLEDVVLVHMAVQVRPDTRVFAIDTGRLNEETYQCADAVRRRLGVGIEWYFPKRDDVERLEREKGLFSFHESLEARHECCRIRKVEPLSRALSGLKAWITGLRRGQGVTRSELKPVVRDEAHGGIIKISPLAAWELEQLWNYVRHHNLPYNRLHDFGYPSIGCEPCTRAVRTGEDSRAGRWWWESPEHKECGLHIKSDKQDCKTLQN